MLTDIVPIVEASVQTAFDWDATFAETKELVKEDAELTATIDDAMVKRFHGRVKIGFNLMGLQAGHSKNRHGDFTTVILPDLGINERFAQRCISVARLYQNSMPTSLSALIFDLPMPMDAWHKLASPSGQTVVQQLESGEIDPTQDAIKKALEDEKARLAAEKQRADQAERQAKIAQQQLSIFQEHSQLSQDKIADLTKQIEDLQQQIKTISTPEKVEVTPQSVLDNIEAMKAQIAKLTDHKQLLLDNAKKLSEELKEQRSANEAQKNQELYETQIKDKWCKATEALYKSLTQFLGQMPSSIDLQIFDAEEWARHAQIEGAIRHFMEIFLKMKEARYSQVVDSVYETSVVVINE